MLSCRVTNVAIISSIRLQLNLHRLILVSMTHQALHGFFPHFPFLAVPKHVEQHIFHVWGPSDRTSHECVRIGTGPNSFWLWRDWFYVRIWKFSAFFFLKSVSDENLLYWKFLIFMGYWNFVFILGISASRMLHYLRWTFWRISSSHICFLHYQFINVFFFFCL